MSHNALVEAVKTEQLLGVRLEQLNWFVGAWQGTIGADVCEETWNADNDGLMGMFRWIRDGKTRFYEFITLVAVDDAIHMRFKHFSPDLTGWEAQDQCVEFVLTELDADRAAFFELGNEQPTWLIYERPEPHRLEVRFEVSEGKRPVEGVFRMALAGLSASNE